MTVDWKGTERGPRNKKCKDWKCNAIDTLSSRVGTADSVRGWRGMNQGSRKWKKKKEAGWKMVGSPQESAQRTGALGRHHTSAQSPEANGEMSTRKKTSQMRNFRIKISRSLHSPTVWKDQDTPYPLIKKSKPEPRKAKCTVRKLKIRRRTPKARK